MKLKKESSYLFCTVFPQWKEKALKDLNADASCPMWSNTGYRYGSSWKRCDVLVSESRHPEQEILFYRSGEKVHLISTQQDLVTCPFWHRCLSPTRQPCLFLILKHCLRQIRTVSALSSVRNLQRNPCIMPAGSCRRKDKQNRCIVCGWWQVFNNQTVLCRLPVIRGIHQVYLIDEMSMIFRMSRYAMQDVAVTGS